MLRDEIDITDAFEIIYDAEIRKLCCSEHYRLGKQLLQWIKGKTSYIQTLHCSQRSLLIYLRWRSKRN